MNKFFFCLLTISVPAIAQNRLKELYTLEPCDNLACSEKVFKSWVDSLAGNHFVSDVQHSGSPSGDGVFLSFALFSRYSPLRVNLPKSPLWIEFGTPVKSANGRYKTSGLAMELRQNIRAYTRSFKPAEFDYSPYSYFRLGCTIFKLSDDQLVAHILNFFVGNNKRGTDKIELLIEDVRKKKGNRIVSADIPRNNFQQLISELKKAQPDLFRLMYDVYIHDKNKDKELKNIDEFFRIMSNRNIIDEINDYINISMKLNLGEKVRLLVPQSWIVSPADTIRGEHTALDFRFGEFLLNRSEHQMEFTFKLNQTDTMHIVHGENRFPSFGSKEKAKYDTEKFLKARIQYIKLIVGMKEIKIYLETEDYTVVDLYRRETGSF